MPTRQIVASLIGLLPLAILGCAKPSAAPPSAAEAPVMKPGQALSPERMAGDPKHPAIVHVVSRDQVITVRSGPDGPLYSIKDAGGQILLADATGAQFEAQHPDLYRQIRHYIAVKADDGEAVIYADHATVDR